MAGVVEAVRSRLFGPRKEQPSVTIAALEQEFAGVTPVELAPYSYTSATKEEEGRPAFRMSKEAVEIMHVADASKARGEELRADFVFTPTTGARKIFAFTNTQTEEELQPGDTFRFTFPPEVRKQVFIETGKGLVYVKGPSWRRWIFVADVSCFVSDTLRGLSPAAGEATQDGLQAKWNMMRGPAKRTWGQLTDDDLSQVEGRRDLLVGKLQEKYGYSKARANEEVDMFIRVQQS